MKKRALCLALALCMVMGFIMLPGPAVAYANENEDKLAEAKEKAAALQDELEAARARKESAMDQKYILDQRSHALMEEISLLDTQIQATTVRIEENEQKEAEQYELFCRQVRREEERGTISYWSVLFKAKSFTDLLGRLDFVGEVMAHDQEVIDNLRTIRAQLTADRTALEEQRAEQESAQNELEEQIAEADALVKEYAAQEGSAKAMYDAEVATMAEIEAAIRAYNEEQERLAREAEAQRQAAQSGGDESPAPAPVSAGDPSGEGYAWPTNDTRLITSPVGFREAWVTDYIGTTNHEGVDIGASYGTNILASKSGTVILASWYGGLGYCVVIQHGAPGYYTVYGHMSRILCDVGQQVGQGQVIGLVGSTGNSTGPHIHFEIHENYVLLDPLDYLSGWVRYW